MISPRNMMSGLLAAGKDAAGDPAGVHFLQIEAADRVYGGGVFEAGQVSGVLAQGAGADHTAHYLGRAGAG